MLKSVRSLDQITVASPCNADWESMIGNDQVRFCDHCDLKVTDLSRMTRPQAMRFVAQSRGRLCVRYVQRPNGEILTKQLPQKLHHISRRVSGFAAAAFSATLGLASSAAAQSQADARATALAQPQAIACVTTDTKDGARLGGVVKDPNSAVVPQAKVTLTNTRTNTTYEYVTQDDGAYKFSLLEAGSYNLMVDAPGFSVVEKKDLALSATSDQTVDVDLVIHVITAEVEVRSEITEIRMVTMGVVAISEPENPFVKAAYKDDLAALKELFVSTPDVNVWDQLTNTNALAYAIENHNREMVRFLLSAGASINSTSKYGKTPAMYLDSDATVELVRDLVSAGADVNTHDESGVTVLSAAIRECSLPVVKQLIDAGARMDAKDEDGNTILMRAAENEDPNVLRFLLRAGVDVHARNDNDESALTMAASAGRSQNLKALIDAGAISSVKQEELDELLLQVTSLDDPAAVKMLIDVGANTRAKASDDGTALMHAAQAGKPETIKILLAAGSDLDAADRDGWTAIMHADNVESVRLLLNAGADMNVKSKDGKTALALAIENNRKEIVKLLKSRGAPE